jgi:carbamoyltransferase
MEYGPRALGHRSILARPDRPELRDRLNLILKRRVWYQPFCPSILDTEARSALSDFKGAPNRHMTTAYNVRPEWRPSLAGVLSIDGTCRPQLVADDEPSVFGRLLRAVRTRLGYGAVLNTSFNIHGSPLVCTPVEALDVLAKSGADWLAIGPFLVEGVPRAAAVNVQMREMDTCSAAAQRRSDSPVRRNEDSPSPGATTAFITLRPSRALR